MQRTRLIVRPLIVLLVFMFIISLIPAQPAAAATYQVTTTDDVDGGTCNATHCSLREAINAANANASDDTITFTAGANGTITLTSDLPGISGALTITGNGTANTIISRNNARRVLTLGSHSLDLSSFTVRDGSSASGGGMYASETLTLTNMLFDANSSDLGGALFWDANDGSLTVNNSVFTNNQASVAAGAFVINSFAGGSGTITNSLFAANMAGGGPNTGHGAAMLIYQIPVTISSSTISNNVSNSGRAINTANSATVNLHNTIVANTNTGIDCAVENAVINAQNSLIPGGVTTDLAGKPRIQQTTVDMGAYESPFTLALPEVTITPATFNVDEGANADFTITRTGSTASALTIGVTITQGTDTVAADYTLSGGSISGQTGSVTVTIPAGSASVAVNLAAADDTLIEADETLTLTLVDGAEYNLGATTSSTATIIDNDSGGVTVNPTSGLITDEGGLTDTFTVVLNSQPTADVTISLSSSDTTEGTVAPANLTFTTVNWNTAQTVTVTGVDDPVDDGDIVYTIVTENTVSTDPNYADLVVDDVSVTNEDSDEAGVLVDPFEGLVTTEAGDTATFTIVLNTQPSADVTIDVSSSNTTEGTVSPASFTFNDANWDTPQTFTVTGVDDALIDGDISYTILVTLTTDAPEYSGFEPDNVGVTNTDDDSAGITVSPISGLVTTEAGGTATFTVVLISQPTADVTVNLSSSDTTEGTAAPANLTFTAANWNVAQMVTITGVDDALVDGDVAYTIVTGTVVSADANYNGVDASDVSVTNTDNDSAGITVNPTSGLVTTEAGGTATFTVVLNSQPTGDVTIDLASSNIIEGVISPLSLTFTAANWNIEQVVTVTGVDDSIDDDDVAYTIVTGAAVSTDANYNGVDADDVAVTNTDDDTAGTTITPTMFYMTENSEPQSYQITLATMPSAPVTLALNFDDDQLVVNGSSTSPVLLTFTSGGTVTVSIDVVNNPEDNQPRVLTITHTVSSSASPEYPTTLVLPGVTVNVEDAPPPPPIPTCEAHNFDEGGVVRSSIPDSISYAINCRILYQNGSPTSWMGNPLYSEAHLGVLGLLELGVQQAVDIFSPPGLTYFEGGAVFCVRGSGTLIWLAGSGVPRHPEIIGSYTVPEFSGFTCATLFEPGTLILVTDNPLD